jgi:hypothetical protein
MMRMSCVRLPATIDGVKDQDERKDNQGSNVIVIPFDNTGFRRESLRGQTFAPMVDGLLKPSGRVDDIG